MEYKYYSLDELEDLLLLKQRELEWITKRINHLKSKTDKISK
jgi:hypothetical protein